VFEKLIRFFGT